MGSVCARCVMGFALVCRSLLLQHMKHHLLSQAALNVTRGQDISELRHVSSTSIPYAHLLTSVLLLVASTNSSTLPVQIPTPGNLKGMM